MQLASKDTAENVLGKHQERTGPRYTEIFRSSRSEIKRFLWSTKKTAGTTGPYDRPGGAREGYYGAGHDSYGGSDDYGDHNNYGYGNDGYCARMRDGRGMRGHGYDGAGDASSGFHGAHFVYERVGFLSNGKMTLLISSHH